MLTLAQIGALNAVGDVTPLKTAVAPTDVTNGEAVGKSGSVRFVAQPSSVRPWAPESPARVTKRVRIDDLGIDAQREQGLLACNFHSPDDTSTVIPRAPILAYMSFTAATYAAEPTDRSEVGGNVRGCASATRGMQHKVDEITIAVMITHRQARRSHCTAASRATSGTGRARSSRTRWT